MQEQPLVSVLMTSYNREKYIEEAIESVLASGYTNFELLICDDCSKDNTVAIAKKYEAADARIKVYINEENLGDYKNRNKVASYAKGKYLKYLDSDDKIYPWGLEVMVASMEKYPEAGFGLMSYSLPQDKPYPILVKPDEAYRAFYFNFALISMGPTGAIFRREAFEAVNGFSGKPYVGDSEMWLKMSARYPLVRMPNDLVWWRQHEGQQLKEGVSNNFYLINQFKIYKEGLSAKTCPLPEEQRIVALRNLENVRIRQIIRKSIRSFRFKEAKMLLQESDLTLFGIWKGLRKNNYRYKI